MLSRLAVVYVAAICISLSWHELWTSGLKWGNFTLVDDDQYAMLDIQEEQNSGYLRQSEFDQLSRSSSSLGMQQQQQVGVLYNLDTLKCTKNIVDSQLISFVHLVYFVFLFGIYFALFLLSNLVWLRLKNVKLCLDFFETDFPSHSIGFIEKSIKTSFYGI